MPDAQTLEALAQRAISGDREAIDELLGRLKNDVFKLSARMLGNATEAEDASQEILLKVLTHLSAFRGQSSLRTWVWRIAVRHLVRMREGAREVVSSFEAIEALIDAGSGVAPLDESPHSALLAEEVRHGCAQGMLLSLDRDHRIAFVLGDIFELDSEQAAEVLELAPATYRKRLQRARERLTEFMSRKCGIVNPVAACRCLRQIPVLQERGLLDVERPTRTIVQPLAQAFDEMRTVEKVARMYHDDQLDSAPQHFVDDLRKLLNDSQLTLFDA